MYTFRTTTGATCCSGPDIRHLCDACKARAKTVEAPATLMEAVREKRTTQANPRLAAFFNRPRPVTAAMTAIPATTGSVPAAPSLIAAIKERRS